MPIKVQKDLPARAVIEKENIFIMDETRAISQDIRPLEIALVNLMPLKEDTEIQLIRSLSNTPLQVNLTFVIPSHHRSKNTPVSHLNQFYKKFEEIKSQKFDGLIITGAPIEMLEFEEVDFWDEIVEIMDWSEENVTSTVFLCWAAQAALYHFYGINKTVLRKKLSGVYQHKVHNRKTPLVPGHRIPVIQKCHLAWLRRTKRLPFWLIPMKQVFSLPWLRKARRYLSWDIRNMTARHWIMNTNGT